MDTRTALEIIDEAVERTRREPGANAEVRMALKHLADSGVERDTLLWFWRSLFGDNQIGRSQNANASRNRIRFLLGYLPI